METTPQIELSTSLEKLAFLVIKAREFDGKVEPIEPDPGSNPSDDDEREVLEDYAGDPTYEELVDALENLNEDELVEVMALVWMGRGDYEPEDWEDALAEARETRNERAVQYLVGTPNLADELEEGLSKLGISLEDIEREHL
jgi:Protein of unknown function (DUF3775)